MPHPKTIANEENAIQKAVRRKQEVIEIINNAFLEYVEDQDNSWRCKHNSIQLQIQIGSRLFEYFKKMK